MLPFEKMIGVVARKLGYARKPTLAERYPQHSFGRGTYGDVLVHDWREGAKLCVGNYTSFAPGVQILLGGEHRSDWVSTFPFSVFWQSAGRFVGHPRTRGNVTIGNDVWIGTEALVLSGVAIGDGAVVGARAVVTKDVAPYSIVAGNPARLIRSRFAPHQTAALLEIQWWRWSEEQIERAMDDILNEDVDGFISKYIALSARHQGE